MKFPVLKFVSVLALAMGIAAPAYADLTIAAVGPLTGQDATTGEQMRHGAQAAVDAINEAGGLLGQHVNLILKDDACDPRQSVAIANQLGQAGVIGVIGPMCSGSAIPAAKVYNEEGLVMISPSATSPALTDQKLDNVFRTCGRDEQQGWLIADYLLHVFKDRNVAVIQDKTAYGQGLADVVMRNLNDAGQPAKLYMAVNRGERDFNTLVSKLRDNNIDAVFYGGYHTEAGLLVRQMRDHQLQTTFIGDDDLTTHEFWNITGDAGNGVLMSFNSDPRVRPEAAEAVKHIRDDNFEPEGTTLYTYAAVQILAKAVSMVGDSDATKVGGVIRQNTFSTVIGDISFDQKGDVTKPDYIMYQWANGNYAPYSIH